jgi:uncharacterized protein
MKGFISQDLHPFYKILILLACIVAGFFVANFISIALINLLYGYDLLDVAAILEDPSRDPEGRNAVLLFQALTHLLGFTLAPLAFIYFSGYPLKGYLSYKAYLPLGLLLLSGLLFILIMPANSVLIEWNARMELPEFLKGFEQWAREREESIKELTQYLTQFTTFQDLLVGLLVFALIPAVGEEIVFRGILQRYLIVWTRNAHIGIWLAAVIFAAIHVQFFGFLPRMVLGALFGYLYVWSGRIMVPILGHFVNNGVTVLALYLRQTRIMDYDIESVEAMPFQSVLFSVISSIAVLYVLWAGFRKIPISPAAVPPPLSAGEEPEASTEEEEDKLI